MLFVAHKEFMYDAYMFEMVWFDQAHSTNYLEWRGPDLSQPVY